MSGKIFKRVALVHDWLFHMRGGEKVLEAIAELFPEADIYTLFLDKSQLSPALQRHPIYPSFLNQLPGIKKFYKWLLPLFPWLIERFNLSGYDLVISTSHCVAKGVRVPAGTPHVSYIHTPMRYAWFFEDEYFARHGVVVRSLIQACLSFLRQWDLKTNSGITTFAANSENIARKIKSLYQRDSVVIHPPLDCEKFSLGRQKKDYYLVVSALVPYKRIDLAIEAFSRLEKPLWVVGKGEEAELLKEIAGENVRFFEWASDADLIQFYSEARALVFPGEEDFGIVPLEAQASGTPVIAYKKGGALETVKENETGVFFAEQTPEALVQAVDRFEKISWDSSKIREFTKRFSKERFQKEFRVLLQKI